MELQKFKHHIEIRIRTYHVDVQNIVHNAWYLFFIEDARIEYFRSVGMLLDEETFRTKSKFQIVRNTIDYSYPAFFDEVIQIFTRVAYVKNSSVGLEQVILEKKSQRLIVEGTGVAVYLDAKTNRPERLSEEMRTKVSAFEKDDVEFLQ